MLCHLICLTVRCSMYSSVCISVKGSVTICQTVCLVFTVTVRRNRWRDECENCPINLRRREGFICSFYCKPAEWLKFVFSVVFPSHYKYRLQRRIYHFLWVCSSVMVQRLSKTTKLVTALMKTPEMHNSLFTYEHIVGEVF